MLSYITTLKPNNEAIKFVYSKIEPTNEYAEVEYIKSVQNINRVSLRGLVDGKSYISMPVSRHRDIGYVIPNRHGDADFELLGWAVISEYEAKNVLSKKNQSSLNKGDIAQINTLLFDFLINTY